MLSGPRDVARSIRQHWLVSGVTAAIVLAVLQGFSSWRDLLSHRCMQTYGMLNPAARCVKSLPAKVEYEAFKDTLEQRLEALQQREKIEVALYFRDLQSGPWFGINEDKEFFPASLTKLPTMIALLKVADINPDVLRQKIGLEDPPPVRPSIDPADIDKTLIVGETYQVEDVLKRSVTYSDNVSDFLLRMYLSEMLDTPDFLLQLFRELGIASHDESVLTLTVKEYSSLFRILYNAQFLSREGSQKALTLLAESEYSDGLKSTLPPETRVSHKFGFYEGGKQHKDLLQLHDCGIVYHPVTAYTLCVMTRGKNLQAMTETIGELSKAVYDEVSAHAQP